MKLLSFAKTLALLSVTAAPLYANAAATEWSIDKSHSSATFSIRHMMVSNVRGEFGNLTGTLSIDDADITKSSVTAEVDASTINTRDVGKFPKLTFKSTKVEKAGTGLKITGDLTIHGMTKPVVLTAEAPTPTVKDPWGNVKRGFSATAKLSRKDFGLIWNKTLDGGGLGLSDEVTISIDFEANQAKPAAPAVPAKK